MKFIKIVLLSYKAKNHNDSLYMPVGEYHLISQKLSDIAESKVPKGTSTNKILLLFMIIYLVSALDFRYLNICYILGEYYTAMYDYTGQYEDELSFKVKVFIRIIKWRAIYVPYGDPKKAI